MLLPCSYRNAVNIDLIYLVAAILVGNGDVVAGVTLRQFGGCGGADQEYHDTHKIPHACRYERQAGRESDTEPQHHKCFAKPTERLSDDANDVLDRAPSRYLAGRTYSLPLPSRVRNRFGAPAGPCPAIDG